MSRLRADITWKHRININSSIPTPFSIINDIEESNYINIEKNVEKNVENIKENLKEENIERRIHLNSVMANDQVI